MTTLDLALQHARGDESLARLDGELLALGRVVVAFSGGADSAFVLHSACRVLGIENVVALTAISPSLAPEERVDCELFVRELGVEWRCIETSELESAAYQTNDGDRCFHCKTALMDVAEPVGAEFDATVILGVNVDDLGDHRPGQRAAAERGAKFPLVDAGFSKAAVREWSKHFNLRTWNKPAAACLASRVPYGTPVTLGTLSRVARAESSLRALGFKDLRVRHYQELARIEVGVNEIDSLVAQRANVIAGVKAAGYRYVTLDLEGFRSGNLNDALGAAAPPSVDETPLNL